MPRITANSGTLLSVTFYADESPTNADGSVTVTLTTPAGTPLVSTTATSAGNGTYTYVLAPQATPVLLNVLWSGTFGGVVQSVTDTVEVVGARLFSLADARASDVMLADTSRYTTAKLEQARLYVEDEFRSICSVSFIPTYHREIYDGPGGDTLYLRHVKPISLISVTEDGTAYTSDQLATLGFNDVGILTRYNDGSTWTQNRQGLVIEYVAGFTQVPRDIARAGLIRLRSILAAERSAIPDRAVSFVAAEGGTYTLATPGRSGSQTGIPDVDGVLKRYSYRIPGIA